MKRRLRNLWANICYFFVGGSGIFIMENTPLSMEFVHPALPHRLLCHLFKPLGWVVRAWRRDKETLLVWTAVGIALLGALLSGLYQWGVL